MLYTIASYSKRILIGTAFLLVPALWTAAQAEPAPLTNLIGAEATESGIDVTVPTGGCTKKEDFEVTSQSLGGGKAVVTVRRLKPDDCKGNFPSGLKLTFTWSELRLPEHTRISFKNRIDNFGFDQRNGHPAKP
jgi:hypothetical protein